MNLDEIRKRIECEQQSMPKQTCCCGTRPPVDPGVTPTLTIGTVTTGEPGSEADASIPGTAPNFVLNLTIPQGETGPQGEQGIQGIQGEQGETGPAGADGLTPNLTIGTVTTGEPGTEATASITGTAPNFVLNLTIPQGEPGTNA